MSASSARPAAGRDTAGSPSAPPIAAERASTGLSLDAVWVAIVAAFPFVVLNFSALPVDDGDLWWTLALGRAVWLAGALPASDPLAYTPTPQPYYYAQWLAGIILYGAYQLGGYPLLIFLRAAIVGAVFALLYVGCRRAGAAPALAGLCTILALPLVNGGLSLRPQILALLPFVLYLEATRYPAEPGSWRARLRTWLPLVMVFWANVHGSFLFGLGLAGAALVGRFWDLVHAGASPFVPRVAGQSLREGLQPKPGQPPRLSALTLEPELASLFRLFVLSALAPLVNPYGLDVLRYLREYLSKNPGHGELGGLLTEWLPTTPDLPGGPAFFVSLAVLLLATAAVVLRCRCQPFSVGEMWRLLLFGVMGLRWIRGIVWWGLVLPAPLAGMLQRALSGPAAGSISPTRSRANTLVVGLIALVGVATLPWWRADQADALVEPSPLIAAVDQLVADPPGGRPFHSIAWGPFLAWRQGPGTRIFADGRYEVYEPIVFTDYTRLSRAEPGWESLLVGYGVGYLVLSRAGQGPLVTAAERSPDWQRTYAEGDAVVFRRVAAAQGR